MAVCSPNPSLVCCPHYHTLFQHRLDPNLFPRQVLGNLSLGPFWQGLL